MLAIAGGKGGSGKTTTTACLARELAADGERPIAVDGDCDLPDLHVVAGAPAQPGIGALASGTDLSEVIHSAVEIPGVDVLPTGSGDVDALEAALAGLSDRPRRVLVDTPAGASPVVATALRAADGALLVTTPTRESLEDAAKTAAMARALGTTPHGTIVTRSDGSVDPATLLGCPTLAHVPAVSAPLTADAVTECYRTIATLLNKRNI